MKKSANHFLISLAFLLSLNSIHLDIRPASDLIKKVQTTIRNNPAISAFISAGLGTLAGLAFYKYYKNRNNPQKYIPVELSESEKEILAYYCAGTAFLYLLISPIINAKDMLTSINITQLSPFTFIPINCGCGYSLDNLHSEIKFILAGKATLDLFEKESLYLPAINAPIDMIKNGIFQHGISETLYLFNYEVISPYLTQNSLKAIEDEIIQKINSCYKEVYELLKSNRDKIQLLAQELMKRKTMSIDEIQKILNMKVVDPNEFKKESKRKIAYHEAGHAIVNFLNSECQSNFKDTAIKLTIKPEPNYLGALLFTPAEFLGTKNALKGWAMVKLGGRAAEDLVFKEKGTGCSDDLKAASQLVEEIICGVGIVDFYKLYDISEETKEKIEQEMRSLMNQLYEETKALLQKNRDKLDALAHALLEKETLSKHEILSIIG